MEGKLDPESGEYLVDSLDDETGNYGDGSKSDADGRIERKKGEPRVFMFCNFLHHPGLASIQYKTFFHMCRLEQISFDMEKR